MGVSILYAAVISSSMFGETPSYLFMKSVRKRYTRTLEVSFCTVSCSVNTTLLPSASKATTGVGFIVLTKAIPRAKRVMRNIHVIAKRRRIFTILFILFMSLIFRVAKNLSALTEGSVPLASFFTSFTGLSVIFYLRFYLRRQVVHRQENQSLF